MLSSVHSHIETWQHTTVQPLLGVEREAHHLHVEVWIPYKTNARAEEIAEKATLQVSGPKVEKKFISDIKLWAISVGTQGVFRKPEDLAKLREFAQDIYRKLHDAKAIERGPTWKPRREDLPHWMTEMDKDRFGSR